MNPILQTLLEIVAVLLFGAGVGSYLTHNVMQHQIDALKLTAESSARQQADAAIKQIVEVAANMHEQADNYRIKSADLDAGLARLQKELHNAKPLPVDCRPDDFRMQHLREAVRGLQDTLAGQRTGSAVPDPQRR